ncbi:uncharacterized protein [Drosophila kikkawai]|uniref:Uncharacterized protein n=1 Tax=Drosophila kikkawai TaxID=30033 RepID=A0A6P4IA61_DROKI|nr:uncharacterized protein LOC108072839 [Drosophila kikkawai]
MSNHDGKDNRQPEMERPFEMLINRSFMDHGQPPHMKTPADSDFSMNGALIAFMRAKSVEDHDATPIPESAQEDDKPPLEQTDPHPWMRCCGRNFKHSIFSLQPSRTPKRGLGRHRRGLSREQQGQPTP